MRVADPPRAAQRFYYEITNTGHQVVVVMTFPNTPAADAMADWVDDVLCDAIVEAHEAEAAEDE